MAEWYALYRVGPTERPKDTRRERRQLARAKAAGDFRRERARCPTCGSSLTQSGDSLSLCPQCDVERLAEIEVRA